MEYKAVIFDLNGVFIRSPFLSDRFRQDFGVPTEEFLSVLKEVMAHVRLPGADSVYSRFLPHLQKWGVHLTEEQFLDYWFGAEKEVPEMITLASGLGARGMRVIILSNNFRERAEYYDRNFRFLREMPDAVYYSWRTGLVKPDEAAYRLIMKENGLRPEECIYFDDSEKNVSVASALGIRAFDFDGPEQVRTTLRDLGVLS